MSGASAGKSGQGAHSPGPAGEDRELVSPGCPRGLREAGAGCRQKPHRAQVSSLGQKGQEERRATGKGNGWRKHCNSGRGLRRDRRCTSFYPGQPVLLAQPWPGGGARPLAALTGSAQRPGGVSSDPASQGHYQQPHLSPHPAWNPPQVPEGRVGGGSPQWHLRRAGGAGGRDTKRNT